MATKITIKASKATSKARIPIAEMAKEINLAADEIRTAIFVMRHREERNRQTICCEIAQTPPGGGRLARRSSKRQAGRTMIWFVNLRRGQLARPRLHYPDPTDYHRLPSINSRDFNLPCPKSRWTLLLVARNKLYAVHKLESQPRLLN